MAIIDLLGCVDHFDGKELAVLSSGKKATMLLNFRNDWLSIPIWIEDVEARDAHLPLSVKSYIEMHKLSFDFIKELYTSFLALETDELRDAIRSTAELWWNVGFNGLYWAPDSVTEAFTQHQRPVIDDGREKELYCEIICAMLYHNLQIIRPENMDDLDRQQ